MTTTGPSWKPLPVIFTTPFSLAGDDGAPLLWLWIARAGGILAFAMAFRLGKRLAGPVAGVIAAGSLFLADEFIRNFFRGNSEGILVALCLWAIERHLDGRRRDAFLLGLAAALLRPEVWPFIALYGLYLIAADWHQKNALPVKTTALVIGGGLGLGILWFLPEYLGSGDFLRAAARARKPNPDSAAFADHPFIEVFRRIASVLSTPVYVGGVLAVIVAIRAFVKDRKEGLYLAMATIATVLMVAVAAMTQAGFAGNLRYVALPAALVCVLAGAGWVWLVRTTQRPLRCRRRDRARGRHRRRERAVRDPGRARARHGRPAHQGRGRPLRHGPGRDQGRRRRGQAEVVRHACTRGPSRRRPSRGTCICTRWTPRSSPSRPARRSPPATRPCRATPGSRRSPRPASGSSAPPARK